MIIFDVLYIVISLAIIYSRFESICVVISNICILLFSVIRIIFMIFDLEAIVLIISVKIVATIKSFVARLIF